MINYEDIEFTLRTEPGGTQTIFGVYKGTTITRRLLPEHRAHDLIEEIIKEFNEREHTQ